MTTKEMVIQNIEWQIEDAYKEIKNAQERFKAESEARPEMINPIAVQNAAMKVAENQKKLHHLYETKKMIEAIAEEA